MNEAPLPEYLQDKEWHSLLEELPDGWEAAAAEQKAIQRLRKITSPGDLLRLSLIYATTLSLRLTALWAAALSIAEMSHQAVSKRLMAASLWLSFLLGELINERVSWPEALPKKGATVVLLDATAIARSKSPGVEWRIHLHFSPWHQAPLRMTLTDVHGGEHVRQLGVAAGDIVVADRGYGVWSNTKFVLDALAYPLFRLAWNNFPLQTTEGKPFEIIAWLRVIPMTVSIQKALVFARDDEKKRSLRLIASRLPAEAASRARQRVRQAAKKKGRTPMAETLLAAGFCIVITSLPEEDWRPQEVLLLYRCRWKSIVQLKDLPNYPSEIAEVVLRAKLLLIWWLHRRIPTGWFPWRIGQKKTVEPPLLSTLIRISIESLVAIIRPPSALIEVLKHPERFYRYLRPDRRRRPYQLGELVRLMIKHDMEESRR